MAEFGDDPSALRTPPHSLEAEQAVIGGLLLDAEGWDRISDKLRDSDFYSEVHAHLYRRIGQLIDSGQPPDSLTLAHLLESDNKLAWAGGLSYLGKLLESTPSAANLPTYANMVRERSVLRRLARAGNEITESVFTPSGQSVQDLLDSAEAKVFDISEGQSAGEGPIAIARLVDEAAGRIQEARNNPSALTGIDTGFDRLNEFTTGFQRGDLIIIAGRPSMGKTAFAMNIAEHVAVKLKLPTLVFSLEMSSIQLTIRMLGSLAKVNQQNIRTGNLDDEEWRKLTIAFKKLSQAPLYLDDSPATIMDLRSRSRRFARQLMRDNNKPLSLVVIDYLQLVQSHRTMDNRSQELGEFSRALKATARELNAPVVTLSQLSRAVESRDDKRPMMSDLRESGSIEQDADVILSLYRDSYYKNKGKQTGEPPSTESEKKKEEEKGKTEIIINKQRNGPVGTILLEFLDQFACFQAYLRHPNQSDYQNIQNAQKPNNFGGSSVMSGKKNKSGSFDDSNNHF